MKVYTDLPGVQFYTGNFLEGVRGKRNMIYHDNSGFCLETQYYPNAANEESFPSPVLKKGEKYDTTTIYQFGVRNFLHISLDSEKLADLILQPNGIQIIF